MVDSIKALQRENKDVLWGSMVKQTMQRKRPSFSEGYYGYSSFSELLEDAEKSKLITLEKDRRAGTYVISGLVGGTGRARRRPAKRPAKRASQRAETRSNGRETA